MEKIRRFLKDEDGVTALEYALIAGLIALVIIVSLRVAGQQVSRIFQVIATTLSGV